MKRLLRYTLIALACALAVLVLGAWWILGTSSGARWALDQVSRFSPLTVKTESVEGSLCRGLRIEGLRATWAHGSARIRELRLDLALETLLFGQVGMRELEIKDARIEDNRPETPSTPGLNWPRTIGVSLPPLRVKSLVLEDITYRRHEQPPVRIERAETDLRLSRRELSLRGMSLSMPQFRVRGNATVGLGRPRLDADIVIHAAKPIAAMDEFSVRADLHPAEGAAILSGTVEAAALSASKKIAGAGADVTVGNTALVFKNLKLAQSGRRGAITGQGVLTFAGDGPVIDSTLVLHTIDLSKEVPGLKSVNGSVSIKGGAGEYEGRMSLTGKGTAWQTGSIEAAFHGTTDSFALTAISGKWLEGRITGSARAEWKKTPAFSAAVNIRGMNPVAIAPEWSGEINMNLKASATMPDRKQPSGTLSLRLLNSSLRGRRLTGDLRAGIDKGVVRLDRLALHGMGFDVTASGDPDKRLDFSIGLADLSLFRKETEGRASAKGWIGKREGVLTGKANARGNNILVNGLRVRSVNASGSVEGRNGPFSLDVSARDVTYNMLKADVLACNASGSLTDHSFSASLRSPVSTIAATAAGSYIGSVWTGTITQLAGTGRGEEWNLREKAALVVSADRFSLSPLVLAGPGKEQVELQASINTNPLSGSFLVEWRELNIARINPWITGISVSGYAGGRISGKILPEGRLDVVAAASLSRGNLIRRINDLEFKADIKNASLSLAWRGESIQGNFSLVFTEYGGIKASLQAPIPARLPFSLNRDGALRGSIAGQIREMGAVSFLFPGLIQESRGKINLDIGIAGTWNSPDLQGSVELNNAGAFFPVAGIHVSDIQLAAAIGGGKITIKSFSARSDPGWIKGEATVTLKGWRPERYEGRLQGERFRALLLPSLRMLVTPDIEFQGTQEKVQVRGTVRLPELLIYGAPAGGPVEESRDVVIVGAPRERETEPRAAMDIEIKVVLGDRVIVKAEGIDAKLGGQVTLNIKSFNRVAGKGEIKVVEGKYSVYGVSLDIARGRLFFAGGTIENPTLDIQAVRTVDDVKAGVAVTGTMQQPLVKLYSEPAMPDTDILSYIVLGHPVGQNREEGALLMKAAGALLSRGESASLQDQISNLLGVDVLDIEAGEGEVSRSLITVGKYLSSRLYISYGYALLSGESLLRLRYKLGKRLEVESHAGETSGVDLYYTIRFD